MKRFFGKMAGIEENVIYFNPSDLIEVSKKERLFEVQV